MNTTSDAQQWCVAWLQEAVPAAGYRRTSHLNELVSGFERQGGERHVHVLLELDEQCSAA